MNTGLSKKAAVFKKLSPEPYWMQCPKTTSIIAAACTKSNNSFLLLSIVIVVVFLPIYGGLFFSIVKQILHIDIKKSCDFVKRFQVRLYSVTTPLAYGTCGLAQLIRQPSSCLVLLHKNNFNAIEILH